MAKKYIPTIRSPKRDHDRYGIENWFEKKYQIKDKEEIQAFVHMFCDSHGFKECKLFKRFSFCGNRFSAFAVFVGVKRKALLELSEQETINP